MPRQMTASEVQQKHAKNLKASSSEIIAGVNATSEAPSAKAVAKQDKMRENLIASIDDGTWAARLGKYTLQNWKSDMINKGVGRISKGIDEAAPKVTAFYNALLPVAYAIRDEVKAMPDMTLDDSVARAETAIRRMAAFKYKKTS